MAWPSSAWRREGPCSPGPTLHIRSDFSLGCPIRRRARSRFGSTRPRPERRKIRGLAAVSLTTRDAGSYPRPTDPTFPRETARRLPHDVSPVPAGQPAPRPVLPGVRCAPRAPLRRLWRRAPGRHPLLPPVRPRDPRRHGGSTTWASSLPRWGTSSARSHRRTSARCVSGPRGMGFTPVSGPSSGASRTRRGPCGSWARLPP